MLDERDFFVLLQGYVTQSKPVPPEVGWRAQELFKDMAEEFISHGQTELAEGLPRGWPGSGMVYQRVREVTRDTPPSGVYDFVLKHAEEYMQTTGREGNWAGSSEMVALAHALGRSFVAYGNNWVSQDEVELRATDSGGLEVLPYFAVAAPNNGRGLSPVRIFQMGGGGHYQMLLAD